MSEKQNGTATANAATKTAATPKVAAPLTNPNTENKPQELSSLSVGKNGVMNFNQRVEKLQELNSIHEKYDILKQTKTKLDSFKLSTDKNADALEIRDGNGNSFRTTNTAIIKDVVAMVSKGVEDKLAETEALLVF